MEIIKTMLEVSIFFRLLIIILLIFILWLIIKSAVKAGIIAAYEKITSDPQEEKEKLNQEIEEEQKGWS